MSTLTAPALPQIYSFGHPLDMAEDKIGLLRDSADAADDVEELRRRFAADGYLYMTKEATGRWFRYDFAEQSMVGWSTNVYPSGAAVLGDTAYDVVEPETGIRFVQYILNTSNIVMRCMVV